MSKQIKITILLDQPLYPESDNLLRLCLNDSLGIYSSYNNEKVIIEEIEERKKIDLLKLAKENYPLGTIYKYHGLLYSVQGELKCVRQNDLPEGNIKMITDGFGGSVYSYGIWSDKKNTEK